MKPIALLELVRPLNCIMAAFGVLIGFVIAASTGQVFVSWQMLAIAMAVAFIVCGAGQAINDVFDSEIDRKLRPKKPIPSEKISRKSALIYSLVLFAIGNCLALWLPLQSLLISLAFTAILIIYSAKLQKAKFIGNWVVALGTAFTLVFGASLAGKYGIVLVLAGSALLANAAREIIKDTQDMGADRGVKVSLPMLVEMHILRLLVLVLYIVAFALAILAGLVLGFGNFFYPMIITIAMLAFLYSAKLFFDGRLEAAQKYSKIGMLVALIGFFLGAL
ncbi:MAG: geranylgeranylglycerol-phosphate geranylgeranyltransferase [Candidatus ainarchaeum sp.]|nr:geranylgeranylglycerol-phosphate geranylgeranyltransferase [Candidatus ainarchaeum sp.]